MASRMPAKEERWRPHACIGERVRLHVSAERIPNNVDLSDNKRLQRALEHWQPKYNAWWRDMGPPGFQEQHRIYLRTAVSVDPDGLGALRLREDARVPLGHLSRRSGADRRIGFGDFHGQPVWHDVPGRVPQPAAPPRGDAGRHRAGERRAATARSSLPERVRPAEPVSGERRGRPSPLGDGVHSPLLLRPRRPR